MTTPECFGCGESFPGGMLILGQYLCPTCEAKILKSRTGKFDYQAWIDNCRRFWEKAGINIKDLDE